MSTGKTDKNISLPATWNVRPLGEVVQPTRPRTKPSETPDLPFIGMENVEAHTMKLLGTVPARTMKSSAVHFQPNDVLYGRLRPYLNKVYRPDFEGLCSAEFIVFPKSEGVSSRYLQYFLNSSSFVSYATHLNAGDRPRVDFEQLSPYPFPVAPYEEQKRIVAEIEKQFSRLDEAVASLKRTKSNLKRYKAAVLKAAVEGKLVPIKDRQTTKIGDVAELVTKGSSPNWQGFNYTEKGAVFVRSQNVGWGELDLSDVAHLPPAFNEKERKSVLKRDDVLLNIVGASIGRAALATPDIEGGNVNQAVAVIRLNQERMLPKYLMLNLLSPGTQAVIHAEKVDVARANVRESLIYSLRPMCYG